MTETEAGGTELRCILQGFPNRTFQVPPLKLAGRGMYFMAVDFALFKIKKLNFSSPMGGEAKSVFT